jgi:hypothetical protein
MSFPLVGNPSLKEPCANQWQKKDSGQAGMTEKRTNGFFVFRSMTAKKEMTKIIKPNVIYKGVKP